MTNLEHSIPLKEYFVASLYKIEYAIPLLKGS
jgi:hypothetical protein